MRLINTRTLQLEDFDAEQCPRYAVLSHRWEAQEITYQDAVSIGLRSCAKKGAVKIRECCRLSRERSISYAWVDTCCIDKTSSAELSEAINSMFRWYQHAKVCFAFLSDVEVKMVDSDQGYGANISDMSDAIKTSRWFTRSWTLQELIAPTNVDFYDKNWFRFGSKASLAGDISDRTNIPKEVLINPANIFGAPIAQRMSWARKRRCCRIEDTAYSLLGIFDVNMPLLYGEGQKAFTRLQEEIIKAHNDHTIFLWSAKAQEVGRLFAPHPDCFDPDQTYRLDTSLRTPKPFSITNLGLCITLPLIPWHANIYLALLDCKVSSRNGAGMWGQPGLYLRCREDGVLYQKVNFSARDYGYSQSADISLQRTREIYIELDSSLTAKKNTEPHDAPNFYGIDTLTRRLRPEQELLYGFVIGSIEILRSGRWESILPKCQILTDHWWDKEHRILEMQPGTSGYAMVIAMPPDPQIPAGIDAIKLAFDFHFRPCCIIGVAQLDPTTPRVPRSAFTNTTGSSSLHNTLLQRPSINTVARTSPDHEHLWSNYNKYHAIPPSSETGLWLLKGEFLLGLSVTLGLLSNDFCVAGYQIKVRMTRELIRRRISWVFDLQISECAGGYCQSHKGSSRQSMLVPPALIVTPPMISPWSTGVDVGMGYSEHLRWEFLDNKDGQANAEHENDPEVDRVESNPNHSKLNGASRDDDSDKKHDHVGENEDEDEDQEGDGDEDHDFDPDLDPDRDITSDTTKMVVRSSTPFLID